MRSATGPYCVSDVGRRWSEPIRSPSAGADGYLPDSSSETRPDRFDQQRTDVPVDGKDTRDMACLPVGQRGRLGLEARSIRAHLQHGWAVVGAPANTFPWCWTPGFMLIFGAVARVV